MAVLAGADAVVLALLPATADELVEVLGDRVDVTAVLAELADHGLVEQA